MNLRTHRAGKTLLLLLCIVAWTFCGQAESAAKEPEPGASGEGKSDESKDVQATPKAVEPHVYGAETPTAPPTGKRPASAPFARPGKRSLAEGLTEGFKLVSPRGFEPPGQTGVLENLKADQLRWKGDHNQVTAEGHVRLKLDNTDFSSDKFYYDKAGGELRASGHVEMKQEFSTIEADTVDYTVPLGAKLELPPAALETEEGEKSPFAMGNLDATNIRLIEPDRELKAGHLQYDFAHDTGEAEDVKGRSGPIYFGAAKLRVLGPASADGEDVWVTTCDREPPHYRIRVKKVVLQEGEAVAGGAGVIGKNARLELGGVATPVYWPRWGQPLGGVSGFNMDFDMGHRAEIGYYINMGQQFRVSPEIELGTRLYPASKQGMGIGFDANYDFTETPTSPLFLGRGTFHSLYVTNDRGYFELYHRQEIFDDTVLLLQAEQWSDRHFYKDFYYDEYKNRTEPRTFANVTYTQPTYLATATFRKSTNGFVSETERMPEVTFHLLERPLAENLYFTFDTIEGYNEREPDGTHAARAMNVARLTYNWKLAEGLTLTPFVEGQGAWYSNEVEPQFSHETDDSDFCFSTDVGTTLQSRFQRVYPGAWNFSAFKHVVVPSLTLSYRSDPTMSLETIPRFDAYDNVYGRTRLESKIDNMVFGRDAETKEVWQVARLTLYQGTDLSNEMRSSDDYEVEVDIRPRPWWGAEMIGEHHGITGEKDLDQPYSLQRNALELYERLADKPYDPELAYRYNVRYGDYDRVLAYLYYNDSKASGSDGTLSGRWGFAYTETQNRVFNREILYGLGYKIGEKWSVAFEHRYDLAHGDLSRQTYEIRRNLHCWEGALQISERESGWDVGVAFSLVAFPGTRVKF